MTNIVIYISIFLAVLLSFNAVKAQKPAIEIIPMANSYTPHETLSDSLDLLDSLILQSVSRSEIPDHQLTVPKEETEGLENLRRKKITWKKKDDGDTGVYRNLLFMKPIFLFKRSPH